MVNPVIELTNEIKSIGKSKDLTKRVDIHTNIEELGILQNSFNKLLKTIKYYYDRLIEKIYTDELTGISNFAKFQKDIETKELNYSILSIDIKSFGAMNRVYGVKVADYLLERFAQKTKEYFSSKGSLYRLYGDEFAVIYEGKVTKSDIEAYIDMMKHNVFQYKKSLFTLSVTIGYDNRVGEATIETAGMALVSAKHSNKNIFKYNESIAIQDEDNKHIVWLEKFNKAIENDNLVPYFMPMKHTKTGKIDKYESLVRIVDDGEVYSPDKFVDVAVVSGQYDIVTQTMIRKTFEYFKDIEDVKFSINFSLSDIINEETTSLLFEYLKNYPYSQNVIIELLETEEISDFVLLNKFITKVKQYNVSVAIDDFGSGYSNFNYILNLDVDIIKLDSSLVKNIFTDQHALVVVSNIVRVAKELGLVVVAERVSDKHIEEILTVHEVDYLQGYHIGEPSKDILK
jgi:diguanylate cyclase (GGDEF)-like protein